MKNFGGPLALSGLVAVAVGAGLHNQMLPQRPQPAIENYEDNYPGGGNAGGGGGGGGAPSSQADRVWGNGTNQANNLPPPPTDGSIPEGAFASRGGTAAICFDGTGYSPVGDTYIPATAHTINGQYLNGDVTPYVVVNRADYGNIPMGTKVYVYNHNTGQGTWAIAGDRGPANHGRAEMSVATANAIGASIPRDSNGNLMNAVAPHNISFHFYN
jgi:hypothetical protein